MDFKGILLQIGQLYQNLTRKQRITIAAPIVVVVGSLVLLALFRNGPAGSNGYVPLIENANPSTAGAVVIRFEQNGIPCRLENESTILVPQD